ncbi:hypothetical protein [Pseudofulvibacter geojedonensis]|uniref:PA14 domain-containing protein n=1 Tax=Pseudofulvibacter geojedonensis TaxID=1123758 RepID=A0ABW3I4X1_9FLAO
MNKRIILFLILFSFSTIIYSQVGIGTTTPNNDAALDISSLNRGLLLPRVPLTSTTNSTPMNNHVMGMVVYNTNNSQDLTPGVYYNDGTKWVRSSPIYYRNHFTQTTSLTIPSNTTYYAIPGLSGLSINVPKDGYYQFNFTGYYATPQATSSGNQGMFYCTGEGYFRINIGSNTKLSYTHSTSFVKNDGLGENSIHHLSSTAVASGQIYLTKGTHSVDIHFYQYLTDHYCTLGQQSVVGKFPGYNDSDECTLSIFYVGD